MQKISKCLAPLIISCLLILSLSFLNGTQSSSTDLERNSCGKLNTAYAVLAASNSIVDVSGAWESNFGTVFLKTEGVDSNGHVIVSGTWTNAGSTSLIIYGRFEPATAGGILKCEYYVPGRHIYGYAEFKLDPSKTAFNGNYHETSQTGSWNLHRAAGYTVKYAANLETVANTSNKRKVSLSTVAGKWDSSFGLVELQGVGYAQGVQVKGKFTRPDGKLVEITSGSFTRDPKGGILKIEYQSKATNTKGSAMFRPDPYVPDRQLLGVYNEKGQQGPWILSRPLAL